MKKKVQVLDVLEIEEHLKPNQRIKQARNDLKLSLEKVAKLAGMTRNKLSRLEKDQELTIADALQLSKVLDISLNYIGHGYDDVPSIFEDSFPSEFIDNYLALSPPHQRSVVLLAQELQKMEEELNFDNDTEDIL